MKKMNCKPATLESAQEKKSRPSKAGTTKKKKNPPLEEFEVIEPSGGIGTLVALEPRIMFDGAAVATGAEVIQDAMTTDQTPIPGSDGDMPAGQDTAQNSDEILWSSGLSLSAPSDRKEIVFIDTSVDDYQTLMAGIDPNAEVILLDPTRDGIEQIAEILGDRSDIDAIHLISHGDPGELQLGTGTLNLASMQGEYADELAIISQALTEEADFLIYGCNFGEGESGSNAATLLAELTGADIAASIDLTGAEALGGDWDLEVQTGSIETAVIIDEQVQEDFAGVLDITTGLVGNWTFDADATDSSGNNYDGTLTGDASIDTADATDIVGEGKLSLDGSGDYVDLSAHVATFNSFSEGTITAWVRTTDSGESVIFDMTDNDGSGEVAKFGIEAGGQLKWLTFNDVGGYVIAYSDATVNDGNWHHVAVTVGAGGNTLYIDGAVVSVTYSGGSSSDSDFLSAITGADSVSIGRSEYTGSTADYSGLVDNVHLYNRVLSLGDIQELMAEAPTSYGEIGHWTFDADATDSSGNNYDGTLTNGATVDTTDTTDQVGVAKLSLDGTNDYVDLSSHVSNFSSLNEGTISAWVNTTGTSETIFSISDTADANSYATLFVGVSGYLTFEVYENGTPLLAVYNGNGDTINDGAWHHVSISMSATGHSLYIDGQLIAPGDLIYDTGSSSTSAFFNDVSGLDAMAIGRIENSSGGRWYSSGLIDDVRVHNRALSTAVIDQLAQEGPVANDDTATTSVDTAVNINLTANDTDLDSETITVLDVSNPTNGTVVNNEDGTVTYTPDGGYSGPDSFTYLTADLDDTVSYWRLDGDATDAVGSNDGTITGTTTVEGHYGDALSFDEVDDKVVISDFAINNEFSISFKIKIDDNTGSLFQYIYSHGDINSTNSLNVFLVEASHGDLAAQNKLRTVIRDTNDTLLNTALEFDASSIIGDGNWHTYTLTVAAGEGAKVYLDGVLQNTDATRGGDAFDPGTNLYLGARQDLDSNRFFGGALDSVQVFNRALSASEANETHTGGSSLGTVNVTIDSNATPVNTVPGAQAVAEDTSLAITGISVNDSDGNLSTVQLSVTNGTLSVTLSGSAAISAGADGTNTLTLSGTQADINATLASLTYQGDLNYTGSDTLTVTSTDANSATDVDTVAITVNAVNDAPTDLSSGIEVNTDGGNDAYLIADDGGAILGGLSSVTFEIQFATDDTSSFTPLVSYATATNDNEFAFVFAGTDAYLYIANNDILLNSIDYTSLRDGTLQHLAVTWDNTNGDWAVYSNGVLIEQGTGHEVGNTIEGGGELVFGNEQDALGGSFQSNQAFKGTYYDVRIWNDVRTAGEIAQYDQQQLALTPSGAAAIGLVANWQMDGLDGSNQVVDIVSGNNLSIAHASGTGFTAGNVDSQLSIDENSANGSHVGFVTTQDPDASETFSYSLTDSAGGRFAINASTGEITVADGSLLDYESSTSHSVTVRVTDSGGLTYDEVLTIQINDLDEAPVNTVPGGQTTNEDTTLTFNTTNSNLISIADDAGDTLVVTVSVNNGTVTLSGTTGLTFTAGDGTADATMTFSGTVEDINAALDGLQYDPTTDYSGSDTLTITSYDQTLYSLDFDANLQGYYQFDSADPGNDSSPSGTLDGTLNGDATVVTDGTRGDVLSLDGTGDYVEIAGTLSNPTNVTLSAWVKYSSAPANGGEVISIGNDIALRVDDWTQGVTGFFWDGTTHQFVGSNVSLADNSWHHIAFSFDDGANTQSLYIDGTLVASGNFTSSITYTGWFPQTTIGTHADLGDSSFDFSGLIDDARIYDRALSASEIQGLASAPVTASDTDTVAMIVTAVNDAPVNTVPGAQVVLEDSALNITGISVNDVDGNLSTVQLSVTNGTLNVTLSGAATISAGANGTNTLTLSGTQTDINATLASLTYQGALNYVGGDTLTVLSTDSNADTDSDMVTITVNQDNDAPVVTASGGVTSYAEQATATVIDSAVTLVDPDGFDGTDPSDQYVGVVQITGNYEAADILGFTNTSKIQGNLVGDTLTLTVIGGQTATVAEFEAALRTVTFYNGSDTPGVLDRTITFSFDDGVDSSNSSTKTVQLSAVNDQAIADLNGVDGGGNNYSTTFTEGSSAVNVTDTDATLSDVDHSTYDSIGINLSGFVDGSNEKITIGGYTFTFGTAETVVRTVGATDFEIDFDGSGFSIQKNISGEMPEADLQTLLRGITYENISENPTIGNRTIDFIPQDGDALVGQTSTSTITVAATNDAPVIANLGGDALTYTEGDGAQVIEQSADAAVSDVDSSNFDTGTLTVSFQAGSDSAEDILSIRNQGTGAGQIGVSGSNVTYQGVTIGTFTGGSGGTDLVITLNASADADAVSALIQNITYENTDIDNPTTGARTVRYILTDGDSGTSANYDTTVTVSAVNDMPIITTSGGISIDEDTSGTMMLSINDPDVGSGNLRVTLTVSNGLISLASTTGLTFTTGDGTSDLTMTFEGTQADVNTALATITYTPNPDYTGSDSLSYSINDLGNTGGPANTFNAAVGITVNSVNDAPVNTVPGAQVVAEDTALNISGISVNDVDGNLSKVQLAVTNGTLNVTLSGSATISTGANGTSTLTLSGTQADINATLASLSYQGTLNYTGADTLTVTSTDANSVTDVDTVAINVGLFVTTTSDVSDGDTSSTAALLANMGADGFISLREAIEATNNTLGLDTISFNIGLSDAGHVYYQDDAIGGSLSTIVNTTLADGSISDFDADYVGGAGQGFSWWQIEPTSLLPSITDSVIIDGSTQAGWQAGRPVIELSGSLAGTGANFNGLTLNSAAGSTIRGLAINQFDWAGIQLNGGGGHTIVSNFIGTDITGTQDLGNRINGIEVSSLNSNNVIGGTTLVDRNVIAGNDQGEITLGSGTGNIVQGNYLGVDVTGMNRLGNSYGLRIYGDSNQIGGTGAGEENVIAGIRLETSAQSNTFEGNFIGTNAAGTASIGGTWGMVVYGSDNVIGGTATGAGNVIAGNSSIGILLSGTSATGNFVQGNFIGTDITGTLALGNGDGVRIENGASNNTIGGSTAGVRNIISGNTSDGIEISGATSTGNIVQGNYIGTDVTGTVDLGNNVAGIRLNGANNIIGGTTAGEGNVIAGNSSGITIASTDATGNTIEGNYIGTDATGTAALGNSFGIWVTAGSSNVIGGTVSGAGNVIAGNTNHGIYLLGSGTTGNLVQGNYIGTTSGSLALGNGGAGVFVSSGASSNIIGGTSVGARNVISGNTSDGIYVTGAGTDDNVIQGNFIGTNVAGTAALGNGDRGIQIEDNASNTQIGGTAAGAGNVISGNSNDGIILSNSSTGSIIEGNFIGTDLTGTTNIGNGAWGIRITNSSGNTIGGTEVDAGNAIAYNAQAGIGLQDTSGAGNSILGNAIYLNSGIGIDLGIDGVTANDTGDGDTGPNDLQNFPVLTSVYTDGSNLNVIGTFNSTASTTYRIEFFASTTADGSGYGEAERYLGFATVTTDGSGNAIFNATLAAAVGLGEFVTATATVDLGGGNYENTSEFAANVAAGNPIPFIDLDADDSSGAGITNFVTSFTEDGGPVTLADSDATLTDLDSANLTSLTVTITNLQDGAFELLAADTTGTNITASYDSGTGVLTLSGTDTVANYEQVLRTVMYDNTSDSPTTTTRVIQFQANDGTYSGNVATTNLTVTAVNDAPVNTVPGAQTVAEDTSLAISGISVTDVDGNLSTVQLSVTNGTLNVTLSGSATISAGANGSNTLTLSGSHADINATLTSLSYQGTLNYTGSDTLTITSTDGNSATDVDTVAITVTNVDDAATIGGQTSYSGNEGDVGSGTMTATDPDGLTDGTYFTVTTPASNGTAAIDPATGAWTFTPTDPNWFGTDSFTVTVTDDQGGTTTQVISVTLANVDDAATIGGQTSYSGNEGDVGSGTMTATDPDGLTDGTYFTVTTPASNGTAAIDPATGAWTFTPTDPNWFGTDSFTVTVTDDQGGTTTQVISVTLANVDDAATIGGQTSYSGNEGDVGSGTMTATDPDGLTDGTYFTVTTPASNGTAAIDPATGAWTFTPTDPNWFGTDSFTVTVTDDQGGTTTQVISVTLANVDDAATIGGQTSYSGNEGDVGSGTMTATDPDGLTDGTYFTVTTPASNGTAAIDPATGAWTFTPTDPNWFGTDSFTVTVTDDQGGTTTQVISVTLANVDDAATIGGQTSYSGKKATWAAAP